MNEELTPAEATKEESIWSKFKAWVIGGVVMTVTVGTIIVGNNPDSAKYHEGMTIYAVSPLMPKDTAWFKTAEECSVYVEKMSKYVVKCSDKLIAAKFEMVDEIDKDGNVIGMKATENIIEPEHVERPIVRVPIDKYVDGKTVTVTIDIDGEVIGKGTYTNGIPAEDGYTLIPIVKLQIVPVRQ
jgi:hypothetical protein